MPEKTVVHASAEGLQRDVDLSAQTPSLVALARRLIAMQLDVSLHAETIYSRAINWFTRTG